jgi:hypothetical protein
VPPIDLDDLVEDPGDNVILSPSFRPPAMEPDPPAAEPPPPAPELDAAESRSRALRAREPTERIAVERRGGSKRGFVFVVLTTVAAGVGGYYGYSLYAAGQTGDVEAPPEVPEPPDPSIEGPPPDEAPLAVDEEPPAAEVHEPAAEPERFELVLSGVPEGARVTVDGEPAAVEPAPQLEPGEYRIEVSADGYEPWARVVQMDDETSLEVDLTPVPGEPPTRSQTAMRSSTRRRSTTMMRASPRLLSNPGF